MNKTLVGDVSKVGDAENLGRRRGGGWTSESERIGSAALGQPHPHQAVGGSYFLSIQLKSTFRIRRRGRPQLHFHFGRPLHAHIMAASFVTLFQWRLNSMLLQENEILLGVKDQIESLISKLDAVGSFTGDADRILGRESCHQSWASELRGMLCEVEDFVDDFIIKVYGQTEKDREESIADLETNFRTSTQESQKS
ncbi:hypothetical protein CK203_067365 [Vitis vinifera]|uniref:Disease resistance N-terminal domain-containing protein n=1 Tax=Vitis vinifera TaxID=29760 RepID=A0A438EFZ4_VITVI|nr:hypothetical protein CK203_067365 [Vitis vinifera]